MKKNILKSNFMFIMTAFIVLSFAFVSYSAVIYSPGANTEGSIGPVNDMSISTLPATGNGVLTDEAAQTISKIVVQENVAQPVSVPQGGFTPTITNDTNYTPTTGFIVKNITNVDALKKTINAPAYILVNATTKSVYASKDMTTKYDPAGLANLMTAYIATTFFKMDDVLKVNLSAVKGVDKDASIAALNAGDTITLKDALASMFVKGCVDSANVVAENVSGNIKDFVELMNKTAKLLGLENTNFMNPSGINEDNQLISAHDMAIIMSKVCENQELIDLLALTEYTLPAAKRREKLVLYSKNSQLGKANSSYNPDITCSRLGYNSKANYCVASMMNYKGNHIIAIVLSAKGSQFSDTKKLLDFGKVACEEDSH